MPTEYLDILDEHGNPTGEQKPRLDVHKDGGWHRAVHLWVLNSRHELLIQRRSATRDASPGMWEMSSAGHVHAGETSLSTALRELKEELGVTAAESDLEFLFTVTDREATADGTYQNNEFDDVYLITKDIEIPSLILEPEEIMEVRYLHFTELERYIQENNSHFVPHPAEYEQLFALLHQRYP